jgi:hypothetical protein
MKCNISKEDEYKYRILFEVTTIGPEDVGVHPWTQIWWSRWMLVNPGCLLILKSCFTLAVTSVSLTGNPEVNCDAIQLQRQKFIIKY